MPDTSTIRRRRVSANGVDFALLEAGPEAGPLALCLHGYPDTAWTWRHLLPELAAAGWHAVAPFMRGYAPSGLPADGVYEMAAVAGDANALHAALGADADALLVGHDWGAVAAYPAAVLGSERWRRVVTMAVPPGPAVMEALLTYDQLRRSWYMFFQLNPLAEMVIPAGDFEYLRRLWAEWSPGYDPAEDVAHVAEALAAPEHLTAALNYYRSALGVIPPAPALEADRAALTAQPPQPTLYLHGADDGCMGAGVAARALDYLAEGSEAHILDGVGHFLHLEDPGQVNRLIVDFAGG